MNAPILTASILRDRLLALADPARAAHHLRFFRTGPGEYGEGDHFLGLTSPQVRAVAKDGRGLTLTEVERLLDDAVHEIRACGLVILVEQFKKADEVARKAIIELYLRRTDRINNWDLVDISCAILGQWLADKPRDQIEALLDRLAASPVMWEQRIAVVSTLPLIKSGDFQDILRLAERLKSHPHDLMHKALGWMLREVGKKDKTVLDAFLERHVRTLPRTTLRYAIERFPEPERKAWLRR